MAMTLGYRDKQKLIYSSVGGMVFDMPSGAKGMGSCSN